MPNLDKTGPRGEGPTGWGRGGCVDSPRTKRPGQGLGRGRGPGTGITLEEKEKYLKERLEEIQKQKETRNE